MNSLSDFEHPCQALADLLTVHERVGRPGGRVMAYVGDGNNVAHSLLLAGAKRAGMHVRIATPPGFEPMPRWFSAHGDRGQTTGGRDRDTDPAAATRPT